MHSISTHGDVLLTYRVTVCVSSLMVQEIKRIIKESEVLKYVSISKPHCCPGKAAVLTIAQRRRHEMAAEEQRWQTGARNPARE